MDLKNTHPALLYVALISFCANATLAKLHQTYKHLNHVFPLSAFCDGPQLYIALHQKFISSQIQLNIIITVIYLRIFALMYGEKFISCLDSFIELSAAYCTLVCQRQSFNFRYVWSHLTVFHACVQLMPQYLPKDLLQMGCLFYFLKDGSYALCVKKTYWSTFYYSFIALCELQLYAEPHVSSENLFLLKTSQETLLHFALAESITGASNKLASHDAE